MGRERYNTNRANDLHSVLTPNRDPRVGTPSVTDAPGGVDPSVARERKRKKQERKDRTAAKAAAAPAPTPAGKGKGKGKLRERSRCATTSISPVDARKPPRNAGSSIRSSLLPRSLRWFSPPLGRNHGPPPCLGGSLEPRRKPLRRRLPVRRTLAIVPSYRNREVVKTRIALTRTLTRL